jgi:hypothetical protein
MLDLEGRKGSMGRDGHWGMTALRINPATLLRRIEAGSGRCL